MPVSRDMLLSELKELQRLTAFEQAVATVRRAQAASTPIAEELAANAERAGERLRLLGQAVRGAGGRPDLVGPVLGKLGALVQTQVNQVQTLQGALLGDLALEHQLRERARYARTLATTLGETSVVPVLDRLDRAHSETIEWLERRLAEVGRTGTSALRATPVQAAVGQVRRYVGAPFALAAGSVNAVGALAQRLTGRAPQVAATVTETVTDAVSEAAATAASTVTDAASTVTDAASTAADTAADVASSAASTVTDVASSAVDTAADVTSSVASTASDVASSAADTASDLASSAADTASDVASSAADTASDVAGSAAGTVTDAASTAADTATSVVETAADATSSAASTAADATSSAASTAADATSSAAQTAADTTVDVTDAAVQAAQATQEALEATGGGDVADDKPPFAGYERLTGDSIMRHVDDTEDVDELRTLLAFEQAHKARKGVLKAVQNRLNELSTV